LYVTLKKNSDRKGFLGLGPNGRTVLGIREEK
jgi:hypothetical protein